MDKEIQEKIAKQLLEMRFKEEVGVDNYQFECIYEKYLALLCPEIETWIDTIFEKQKEKRVIYGDADWSVEIIMDTEKRRVLYFDNHVSCSPITKFLIIQDRGYQIKTHIRSVFDNSDYRKGNEYITRPNLKWYKDRGYSLEHDEKIYHTPLGGSYGDCRDKGFVMTFSKYKENLFNNELGYRVESGSLYHYPELKRTLQDLHFTYFELLD